MHSEHGRELTGAILADKQGGSGLSITFLIKFLYLADCLYAEENGGETFTHAEWVFLSLVCSFQPLKHSIHNESGVTVAPLPLLDFVVLNKGDTGMPTYSTAYRKNLIALPAVSPDTL